MEDEPEARHLTEFLLARIAEDEVPLEVPDWYCTDSARGEGWGSRGDECLACGRYMFDGTESATKDAWREHIADAHGRLRLECEAKRRIVETIEQTRVTSTYTTRLLTILMLLALPYADHPDYRDEWKP